MSASNLVGFLRGHVLICTRYGTGSQSIPSHDHGHAAARAIGGLARRESCDRSPPKADMAGRRARLPEERFNPLCALDILPCGMGASSDKYNRCKISWYRVLNLYF